MRLLIGSTRGMQLRNRTRCIAHTLIPRHQTNRARRSIAQYKTTASKVTIRMAANMTSVRAAAAGIAATLARREQLG